MILKTVAYFVSREQKKKPIMALVPSLKPAPSEVKMPIFNDLLFNIFLTTVAKVTPGEASSAKRYKRYEITQLTKNQ